jgi:hypothetical protein
VGEEQKVEEGSPVRRGVTAGVTFIVLGLALYGVQYLGSTGQSLILTLLGGLGVVGYLFTRYRYLLVLGCILFGLGIGSFGERSLWVWGEFSEIGLGIGFVLIYLIGLVYERRGHWWPLIPGVVLLLLGFRAWRDFRVFVFSERGWPLILVIVGGLILFGTLGRARKGR